MNAPARAALSADDIEHFCTLHYKTLALLVLGLAAFNLGFRLDREFVDEWDEALYATSAWEMMAGGNWAATTFHGAFDYYNSKPPLNVWLIAASFKAFGPTLLALRLPAVICAWLTVLVLVVAVRRWHGAAVSLCAGLVLATTFGFLHVHAGRSANCDAAFALIILLQVVTLASGVSVPRRLMWLGPLTAAAFLLKGFGVLMPVAIATLVIVARWRTIAWHAPLARACVLFALPVAAWAFARWRLDGWTFFRAMAVNDLVSVSTTVMDGHTGTPLYYLNVLQKHHYDWLLAAAVATVLLPLPRAEWHRLAAFWRAPVSAPHLVTGVWMTVTLLVPTMMQTKVAWYLNPFYPAFATCVAALLIRGGSSPGARRTAIVVTGVLVLVVAEAKAMWYSYAYRDLGQSAQGLLLLERQRLHGRHVYGDHWKNADRFVLTAIVGGYPRVPFGSAPADGPGNHTFVLAGTADALPDYVALRCQSGLCLYAGRPTTALDAANSDQRQNDRPGQEVERLNGAIERVQEQ